MSLPKSKEKCPGILIEMRRMTAINNIISMVFDEAISMENLDEFSDELKETVKYIVEKH